jgi:hypothetical protein
MAGDVLHTSPAIDPASRALFVTTRDRLMIFPAIDELAGRVPMPTAIAGAELLPPTMRASPSAPVGLGSPLTLAPGSTHELVLITNLRLQTRGYTYGHLGAWAVMPGRRSAPRLRPLWLAPLTERRTPGPGTLGQAALFRDGHGRRGVWVTTMRDGTYCLR